MTEAALLELAAEPVIPKQRAVYCLDCGVVFELQDACPKCGSQAFMLMTTILNGGGQSGLWETR